MVNGNPGYKHISTLVPSVVERWERLYKGEEAILLPVGMPSLIGRQLFPLRSIAVVHGWSNGGKSVFVHQVNLGTAIGLLVDGVKGCVAINSLEESYEGLIQKYAGMLAHIDTSRFKGGKAPITRKELNILEKWADFVGKLPIFIDDTNFISTTALQFQASALHTGIHGPVLQLSTDYNELFSDKDGDTEEQRLHTIFLNQMEVSRRLGCSVIVISQSTVDKATAGKTWIAGSAGTRGSRGILHNADIVLELYNPVEMRKSMLDVRAPEGLNTEQPWLLIEKYRDGAKGKHIPLGWKPEYRFFFDESLNQEIGNETLFTHLKKAQEILNMELPLNEENGDW